MQQQKTPGKPAPQGTPKSPQQPEVLRTASSSPLHKPKKFGKDGCGY